MGGVVVEHQVDVEIGRHGRFDRAVALVAAADDPAGGDVQGGKQGSRAVARVMMAAPLDLSPLDLSPLDLSWPHRQQRVRAVERLDLRLLIDAQHQRMVGRVELEADDVAHPCSGQGQALVDEQWSCDSLNLSARCGCRPKARQMRPTLEVEMPLCRAMLSVCISRDLV